MRLLLKIIPLCLLLTGVLACKDKKPDLSGEAPVTVSDFIDFFPKLSLSFQLEDTSLLRKDKDSLLISRKVFTQFVPDSVLNRLMGKAARPKIYAMGRAKGDETYLFAKAVAGEKRAVYLFAFDKKNKFIAAMPFLIPDQAAATRQVSVFDNKYTISKNVTRRNADGSVNEGKDVYVLNAAAGEYMLIMTDALDEKPAELINPIDTLSRKQKYTANYGSGKTTLFSFRDGRRADQLRFFIHFEKNNGECVGELKGEAQMKGPNRAEYREPGEQCALQFTFTNSSVTVKELEPCGSRRGLRCSFDGTYSRLRDQRSKPARK